ncbi:AAA family ATPase [Candidatus Pelagibacter sp.]|nr:AAA family ATPase [Candidatus Pelagibacter sp.]
MITQYIKDNKTAEIFNKIFDGDDTGRGKLLNPGEKKKKATWEYKPFDSLSHLLGTEIQGRSNVNVSKGAVRWLAWDIDEEYEAKDFCSKIWIYNRELIPFKSLSGRWHLFLFLDAWTSVNEATKKAKSIQEDLIKLKLEVDKGHTLPNGYSIEKGKPGYWIYLPYSKTEAYSPYGQPLSLTQFIYRYKFRKHPLIAGAIGMTKGGRHKALFNVGMYLRFNEVDITLEDIGALMSDPITDQKEINHANDNEKYDQDHLNKNYNNYLSDLCGGEIPFEKTKEKPEETKITDLKMFDWQDYMALDIPEPSFVIERLFKTKSVNFISGPKGNGKTEFTLGLTDTISKGGEFLNYKVIEPWPVIYIDGEMDEYDLIERRIPYTQHQAPHKHYFNIIHYAQQIDQTIPDIKTEHGQKLIMNKINEVRKITGKTPVIVLDNLRSLSNYKENDSDDWRPIGVWLKNLRALDVVSIVIDHHGKGENAGPRGSSSKTDWANVSIFIKSVSKNRTKGKIRLGLHFDKARGLKPDETEDFECEYDFDGNWTIEQTQSAATEEHYLEQIYKQRRLEFELCRTEERKLDKQLQQGKITKQIYNKLRKAHSKEVSKTQQQLADMLQISVGKLNQLINGSYENYFIKRNKEEYEKSRHPDGSFVTEEALKEYDDLVKEWRQSSENRNIHKLPTEAWLREKNPKNIIPMNFRQVERAWADWTKDPYDFMNKVPEISDKEALKATPYIGDPENGDY